MTNDPYMNPNTPPMDRPDAENRQPAMDAVYLDDIEARKASENGAIEASHREESATDPVEPSPTADEGDAPATEGKGHGRRRGRPRKHEESEPRNDGGKVAVEPLDQPEPVARQRQRKFSRRDEETANEGRQNHRNGSPGTNGNRGGQNGFRRDTTGGHSNRAANPGGDRRQLPYANLRDWDRIRTAQSLEILALEKFSDGEAFDFSEVYGLKNEALLELAASMEFDGGKEKQLSRKSILQQCLARAAANGKGILLRGILDIFPDGNGCLVDSTDSYRIGEFSSFIPRAMIRQHGLRRGQNLTVKAFLFAENPTILCALKLAEIMGHSIEDCPSLPLFKELVPCYPTERVILENRQAPSNYNLSMRIVDLLAPLGLGQRGLIVAPPRTGKTLLLQAIATAIVANRPDVHLTVLLIDERPEEVTDFRRLLGGEVCASTFDETADSHIRLAELTIENARRRVENGEHVLILLDSITRLARAYNATMPSSGRILSGGIDVNALQGPKSFFGAARNIEGGGSLTIVATALIETGSRMDDVIFEEFKGTGNMEIYLDRELAENRLYPAINVGKSGTRKEELLYHPDELTRVHILRRAMLGTSLLDAMKMLLDRVRRTPSNVEFLMSVNR